MQPIYHSRLFVGEGDFSYTDSFLDQHPELAPYITTTELYDLKEVSRRGLQYRLKRLLNRGVEIQLEVDATALHEKFKKRRFERIHWNLPWDGLPYDFQTLPELLKKFFLSCRKIQILGDCVHVVLPQPPDFSSKFHQGYAAGIVEATSSMGYRLISKRKFIDEDEVRRYPTYRTCHNKGKKYVESADRGAREFVFEKVSEVISDFSLADAVELNPNAEIKAEVFYPYNENYKLGYYFDCKTDPDSSEGFSDVEMEENPFD